MEWTWKLEKEASSVVGTSEPIDSGSDAESWVAQAIAALLVARVDPVLLFERDQEVH